MELSVSSERTGDVLTVTVSGEVDLSTGPAVDQAISDAVSADGVRAVHVDLTGVGFLDSSGIALLLKGRRDADERGVAYRVVGAHGITQQVLEMTGVWLHLTGGSTEPASL